MEDRFGRNITYMRISVTDRCNLRCVHCMPKEGVELLSHEDILSYEDIAFAAGAAARCGIKKLRLTGGEPLVRPRLHRLVAMLKEIPGIEQVVLTTNGVLLAKELKALEAAGLDGINFSLNGACRQSFEAFTSRDLYEEAMEGLRAALGSGIENLKINCVPTKNREEDLVNIALFAKDTRASVRYIELMPIGMGAGLEGLSSEEVLELLKAEIPGFSPVLSRRESNCSYYCSKDWQSDIGFISALSHKFCGDCNRIRLTADGKLKSCLAYPAGQDVFGAVKNRNSEELTRLMAACIAAKPAGHSFENCGTEEKRLMSQIGG